LTRLRVNSIRVVRKHRAPKGVLRRPVRSELTRHCDDWSECAERQKVH